mmetsp:Transcript_74895/g.242157  ORF Transcript_74895/g.242157 Transcript_74895/m.242157 type:complete len:272 (-) Transcript_74895:4-819(-)
MTDERRLVGAATGSTSSSCAADQGPRAAGPSGPASSVADRLCLLHGPCRRLPCQGGGLARSLGQVLQLQNVLILDVAAGSTTSGHFLLEALELRLELRGSRCCLLSSSVCVLRHQLHSLGDLALRSGSFAKLACSLCSCSGCASGRICHHYCTSCSTSHTSHLASPLPLTYGFLRTAALGAFDFLVIGRLHGAPGRCPVLPVERQARSCGCRTRLRAEEKGQRQGHRGHHAVRCPTAWCCHRSCLQPERRPGSVLRSAPPAAPTQLARPTA